MSLNYSHVSEELHEVKELLFEACQLLKYAGELQEKSDLWRWFDDEENTRWIMEEKHNAQQL